MALLVVFLVCFGANKGEFLFVAKTLSLGQFFSCSLTFSLLLMIPGHSKIRFSSREVKAGKWLVGCCCGFGVFLEVSFTFLGQGFPLFFQQSATYPVPIVSLGGFYLPPGYFWLFWLVTSSLIVIFLLLGFPINFLAGNTIVASIRMAGDHLGLVPGPFPGFLLLPFQWLDV